MIYHVAHSNVPWYTKRLDETYMFHFLFENTVLESKMFNSRLDFSEFLHVMATHELNHTKESLGWAQKWWMQMFTVFMLT